MEVIYQYVKKTETLFVPNRIDSLVRLGMVKEFISASMVSEVELTIEDVNTLVDC